MKKFCLLLVLGLFSLGAQARTLLVLGDSLSAAYGIDPELGWVSLLEAELRQYDPDVTVVNAAISGDTTAGGLSRLPRYLRQHEPEWVLIGLGGNDGLRGLSLRAMRDNLEQMVEQSFAADAQVLLMGITLPPNYGAPFIRRFENVFRQVAEANDLPLVPNLAAGLEKRLELLQEDGVHPNSEAQPLLLDNVLTVLRPLLELES